MSGLHAFMIRDADYTEIAKIVESTSAAVVTCFVSSRILARHAHRGLWWDDYILIGAWLMLVCGNGLAAAAPAYGFNFLNGTAHGASLHFGSASFIYLAVPLAQTAFAATLIRLTDGWARAVLWCTVILVNVYGIAMAVFAWMPLCNSSFEYSTLDAPHCMNMTVYMWIHIGNTIASLLAFFILAVYPWAIVQRVTLTMPAGERRAVAASMSLVGVAALATVGRIVLQAHVPTDQWGEVDWSYGAIVIVCFWQAEAGLMIVAQTVPILRVLWLAKREARGGGKRAPGDIKKKPRQSGTPASAAGVLSRAPGDQSFPEIELVQLPTGRIVPADEAIRMGHADLVEETRAQQAAGQQQQGQGQETAGEEAETDRRNSDDEVHRIWTDLGLSTRAWSQSPSVSPPRARNPTQRTAEEE